MIETDPVTLDAPSGGLVTTTTATTKPTFESGTALISTDSLSKHYGQVVALDNVSVELPFSSIGLLGPNGAGKTTLLKLLLGLSQPTTGELYVFGSDVRADPLSIRRRIGYMPESDALAMDTTAFEFVRHMGEVSGLPPTEARLRAADMLYLCGLDEERYRMIREFSTGMKQRVKLAQALVHDPDLVFLDEPTNGLDPAGHDEMLTLIRRIYDDLGIAVVVSSHVLEDIERVCDYVMMIDAGRLIGSGYLSDLIDAQQEITVELERNVAQFIDGLEQQNVSVTANGTLLSVKYHDDAIFDMIRDTAVETDSGIRSLATRRTSLEEFYIDIVETSQGERAEQ